MSDCYVILRGFSYLFEYELGFVYFFIGNRWEVNYIVGVINKVFLVKC